MMALNWIAGLLCGAVSISMFAVHAFSDRKRFAFMTLPGYVRWGFCVAGVLLMLRSVDLFSLSPTARTGQINELGLFTTAGVAYALGSFAFFLIRSSLRGHGWQRLHWVEQEQRRDPSLVPVMMSVADAALVVRASGAVATPPNADATSIAGSLLPADLVREDIPGIATRH